MVNKNKSYNENVFSVLVYTITLIENYNVCDVSCMDVSKYR